MLISDGATMSFPDTFFWSFSIVASLEAMFSVASTLLFMHDAEGNSMQRL
jgi:hypothetical protein